MINIHSVNGYMTLLSWRLGNILQLATQSFCKRFVDFKVDPCGRLRDQMEMAARTVPANIAEGSSRHQTSYETELRLLDVARASVSELEGDYINWLMRHGTTMWHTNDPRYVEVRNYQLQDAPMLTQDYLAEISEYTIAEYARFATLLRTDDSIHSACAIVVLCERVKQLLTAQINKRLTDFKEEGGFTENMTQERLATLKDKAATEGAPCCPKCGAPMQQRTIKKGTRQGEQFWGCTNYPKCDGTRRI
ncbi:MAG: four helix bundle protein [Bacteroidales bacterium]|nr:four helix bundle protein [Candidatus Sodaliphilus fimicaballi]